VVFRYWRAAIRNDVIAIRGDRANVITDFGKCNQFIGRSATTISRYRQDRQAVHGHAANAMATQVIGV
jgi:hypothetical protein